MNKFRQLSIGAQVLLTFGTLCAILAGVGALFFFGLRSIDAKNATQQISLMHEVAIVHDAADHVGLTQVAVLRHVLAANIEEMKSLDRIIDDLKDRTAEELATYKKEIDTEEENRLYTKVQATRKVYLERTEQALVLSRAGRNAEAAKYATRQQAPSYDEYQQALNELSNNSKEEARTFATETSRAISEIRTAGDILVSVAFLIALVGGFAVVGVTRRLKEDNGVLQAEVMERKRAEEELHWKTAFLEAQVNSSIDGILVVNQEGKQILQNQRVVDLFKIPRHIADDKDDQTQVKWVTQTIKNPEQFVEKVAHLYAHPDEISRDEIELKDGTILDRYSSPVLGKDGKYYGRIWTFRDITEGRQLEAQLIQSQKMETVGKLAGGIAHEFNSILTAIIGQSELLLGDLPSGSPHCANAIAIRNAADLAAALTKQLLAYGRKQILRSETLNLNQILTGMESILCHLMGGDVDVRIVTATGLPAVKADAGQIEQVIMNIAINAREAMRQGGKLTLETSRSTLDEEYARRYPEVKAGDYVMLAISDTGAGMSEEVKAHLFEPFFTTKPVGDGTGLGLATCHGIIKQSGGHISVYSEIGRGTTFKVYLPQVESRGEVSTAKPASSDLPRGTETILLVEDDASLREMASLLLQRLGYSVRVATNGPEALNMVHQPDNGHIDLLFTDIVMPQMDGKELSDRVHALHPKTKTLFTSAYTENAAVHQGVLHEGVALLQKPFTPSALAQKLRAVLDGHS